MEEACRHGNAALLQELLKCAANVRTVDLLDEPNTAGKTPLCMAIAIGNIDCVAILISAGASVNASAAVAVEPRGIPLPCSPLQVACGGGHHKIVVRLLKANADMEFGTDAPLGPPLLAACGSGQLACAVQLVKARATLEATESDCGATPLYVACQEGYHDCVTLMLRAGAQHSAKSDGRHPLYAAASQEAINGRDRPRDHQRCVELLLASHVDPNHGGTEHSALYKAITVGNLSIVRVLLEARASVNIHDTTTGGTPAVLTVSMQSSQSVAILKELISSGADVNQAAINGTKVMRAGDLPLALACVQQDRECVRLLLAAAADLHARPTPLHNSPLILAQMSGNASIVQLCTCAGLAEEEFEESTLAAALQKLSTGAFYCWGCDKVEVNERFRVCGLCVDEALAVPCRFCSRACQAVHWKRHKMWHREQEANRGNIELTRGMQLREHQRVLRDFEASDRPVVRLVAEATRCRDRGDYAQATKKLRKAIRLAPNCNVVYYDLARTLKASGSFTDAAQMFVEASRKAPVNSVQWGRAVMAAFFLLMRPECANAPKPTWWTKVTLQETAHGILKHEIAESSTTDGNYVKKSLEMLSRVHAGSWGTADSANLNWTATQSELRMACTCALAAREFAQDAEEEAVYLLNAVALGGTDVGDVLADDVKQLVRRARGEANDYGCTILYSWAVPDRRATRVTG